MEAYVCPTAIAIILAALLAYKFARCRPVQTWWAGARGELVPPYILRHDRLAERPVKEPGGFVAISRGLSAAPSPDRNEDDSWNPEGSQQKLRPFRGRSTTPG